MPAPYPLEFRREAVELLKRSGKSVPVLASELGVSPQSLRNWARQIDIDEGRRDGLNSDERQELRRLRRENRILVEEREILKKRRRSSPRTAGPGDGVRVHRRVEGRALRQDDVPRAGGVAVGISRVGAARAVGAGARGRATDRADRRDPPRESQGLRIAADPRRAADG